ncbi:MAG TPA: hypothetical protein VJY64_00990 [Candidatus Onthovivens sp.]|nr:hypothetical protein [Candidatus Onthovivens sp.]
MAEIKGQILGVVLVLAIFSVVAGVLYQAFSTKANEVANNITSAGTELNKPTTQENSEKNSENEFSQIDLISFN